VLNPGDEDLAAGDNVVVTVTERNGCNPGRVCSGSWLRDRECLQTECPVRHERKIALLLILRAVTQKCSHDIHLRVRRSGVTPILIDLLQDRRRFLDTEAESAVLPGNECREPACLGKRLDELLGVLTFPVKIPPICIRKLHAEGPHLAPQLNDLGRVGEGVESCPRVNPELG
jgi:hypothetical protein